MSAIYDQLPEVDHTHHAAVLECREDPRSFQEGHTIPTSSCSTIFRERSGTTFRWATEDALCAVSSAGVRRGARGTWYSRTPQCFASPCAMSCWLSYRSPTSRRNLSRRCETAPRTSRQLAGDFRLDAFVGRSGPVRRNGRELSRGSPVLLPTSRRADWVDPDLDHAAIELADLAQRVPARRNLRACQGPSRQAAGHGRRHWNRRTSGAVWWRNSTWQTATVRPSMISSSALLPLRWRKPILVARSIILAALAELSMRYMRKASCLRESMAREALHFMTTDSL